MTVRELMDELRDLDPDAEVRFFHLRAVKEDGTGRVESYPALEVAQGEGEVTLSDFLTEGAVLFRVRKKGRRSGPSSRLLKSPEPGELDQPEAAGTPGRSCC
jgi:hypothetical protein